MLFGIRYPVSGIRYPLSGIAIRYRYPVSGTRYPVSGIRYPLSGIRYPPSGIAIRYPVSAIRYPLSGIRYPVSAIRYPLNGIRYPVSGFSTMPIYFMLTIYSHKNTATRREIHVYTLCSRKCILLNLAYSAQKIVTLCYLQCFKTKKKTGKNKYSATLVINGLYF